MTERAGAKRGADHLAIGPSTLHWDGDALHFQIREHGAPLPRRIVGDVRVRPEALTGHTATIDGQGRHRWRPIAPRVHVEVRLTHPALSWTGRGYLDSNDGDEPLEAGFRRWDWSRATLTGGDTAILYDTVPRHGPERGLAMRIDRHGAVADFAPPSPVELPPSRWRIRRETRADDASARVTRTLVDAPFYARSTLATRLFGSPAEAMHESVDLDRFSSAATQLMLPFRIPRSLASSSSRANSSSTHPIRSSTRDHTETGPASSAPDSSDTLRPTGTTARDDTES